MKQESKAFAFSVFRTEDEFVTAIKSTPLPLKLLHILLFVIYALAHYLVFFAAAGVLLTVIFGPAAALCFYMRLPVSTALIVGVPVGLLIAYVLVALSPRFRLFGDDGRYGN